LSTPPKIRLCFRLDDPHAQSDHTLEAAIFRVFEKFSVPLSVAVVPFKGTTGPEQLVGASRENMSHVADGIRDGRIELLQHGYAHARNTMAPKVPLSEFVGVEEASQARLITVGRRQLEDGFGVSISGFVPPWNSYDETTTRVLTNAGFRFLSAGVEAAKYPKILKATRGPMTVPCTCNLLTLESSIEEALRFQTTSPALVCVFHPDDFEEFRDPPAPGERMPYTNLRVLEKQLAWVRTINEISVSSIGELSEEASQNGGLTHVSDVWWFRHLPHRYSRLLPRAILFGRSPIDVFRAALRLRPS
jgi:peptidoglycan/xylan/chitin deacetylase (PgdA/CDA1 family)